MYEEFFSFSAAPFRLNPDPKFFFGSRSHNKAMAYLHYGLRQAEGFIVITGEIGAGKSILIGHLIDQLDRSNVVAAHLLTTNLEPSALLSHILSAFRIEPSSTGKSAEIEAFEDFLFDQMNRGRRVLLIVDEAQNLPIRTMEELRMLSNMDYDGTPLFQVFMVGQPEFRGILAEPHMEQFRQRIIASYHLEPLGQGETTDYIRHRLALVGWNNDPSINDEAYKAIFAATGGVPRKINKLCNRILLYCSIEKLHAIDEAVVKAVVTDLKSENLERATAKRAEETKKAEEPARTEPSRAVEAPPREARAANGGEPPAAPEISEEQPAEARKPVVIPFGSVRKIMSSKPNGKEKKPEVAPEELKKSVTAAAKQGAAESSKAPSAAKPAESEGEKAVEEEAMPKKVEPPATPAKKAETAPTKAGKSEAGAAKAAAASKAESNKAAKSEAPAAVKAEPTPTEAAAAAEPPAAKAAAKPEAGAAKVAAQTPPAAAGPMSVLDRLRAQRSGAAVAEPEAQAPEAQGPDVKNAPAESERESERSPATLNDVAKAIAAISAAGEAARKAREAEMKVGVAEQPLGDLESEESAAGSDSLGEPPLAIDPKGWRLTIVKSINETREELKTAHANVARLRKQVGAIDSRRRENRRKIAANLARAESLLTEIRNAWR